MSVDEITEAVAESFPSFGIGSKANLSNPLSGAMQERPPCFALGVDIKEVVTFVLERSGIGKN